MILRHCNNRLNEKKTKRSYSILSRIFIPLILGLLLQVSILYGSIFCGGIFNELKENSYEILSEKTLGRQNIIETEMTTKWSNIEQSVNSITEKIDTVSRNNNLTVSNFKSSSSMTPYLLMLLSEDITFMLRKNAVTGAFVILDCGGSSSKTGIYFRDSDPSTDSKVNSDILAECAPTSVTKFSGIALSSTWQPTFDISETSEYYTDFYYKPFNAAKKAKMSYSDLGYWSKPFCYQDSWKKDDIEVITYTIPLIDNNGDPYGVVGVDLTTSYLKSFIPSTELGASKSGYSLAITNDDYENSETALFDICIKDGAFLNSVINDSHITMNKSKNFGFEYDADVKLYGNIRPIKLYNSNTPFENERWVIIGFNDSDVLMKMSNALYGILIVTAAIVILIAIITILIASKIIANPVHKLAFQVKNSDPNKPIVLKHTNISEIDELSDSIQSLSRQAHNSSKKLTQILTMAGIQIGAFECDKISKSVFCTNGISSLLNLKENLASSISSEKLHEIFDQLEDKLEDSLNDETYLYNMSTNSRRKWVNLHVTQDDERVLGVITDVTNNILEKKRIEHDRDFDLLTSLYNRRAFYNKMQNLFLFPNNLGIAGIMMMDLDNLKYINDTYGHDFGDEYIRATAEVLRKSESENIVVSRLSGDEFIVFAYGNQSSVQTIQILENIKNDISKSYITLPGASQMKLRISAGTALYPYDSDDYKMLIKYADFAMYNAKKSDKGSLNGFDSQSYKKNSYLFDCKEELNTIIEKNQVKYHFQPIVNAKTGDIFAVEALMRPQTENLKNPKELIAIARTQSKLPQIERLTMFRSITDFAKTNVSKTNMKLFINSLSNQFLSDNDIRSFETENKDYLSRIVIEITEEDQINETILNKKRDCTNRWGAGIAMDDFGSGYNGDSYLLKIDPDYVKLDSSIVCNSHLDDNRKALLENLIDYCHRINKKVIAEGVECFGEMETLINSGVDYLQGFYLCRPVEQPPLEIEKRNEIIELNQKI